MRNFKYFTKTNNGTVEEERETVKVSDDKQVIAILDTDVLLLATTIRYQLTNHLDSASLELDEFGHIISYEEYHPFGTTSYRSGRSEAEVSLKRYKYVFKELDNETGLYYYGMRYYAPWIARFVSVDPLQFKYPYYTPFQYAGNKPISYIDLDGAEENPASKLYFQARNNIIATSNGPTVAAAKELDALDASYSIYSVRQKYAADYKQFDKHVENQQKNPNLLVKPQLTPMQQDMRAGRPLHPIQVSIETDAVLRESSEFLLASGIFKAGKFLFSEKALANPYLGAFGKGTVKNLLEVGTSSITTEKGWRGTNITNLFLNYVPTINFGFDYIAKPVVASTFSYDFDRKLKSPFLSGENKMAMDDWALRTTTGLGASLLKYKFNNVMKGGATKFGGYYGPKTNVLEIQKLGMNTGLDAIDMITRKAIIQHNLTNSKPIK